MPLFTLKKHIVRKYQPKSKDIRFWLKAAILAQYNNIYIDISIVSLLESARLNNLYRGKDSPTNVIALEYPDAREEYSMLNGELILCDEIIVKESSEQNKLILAHYAHMIVHGMLHLQGYDHILDHDALEMEGLEVKILASLGYTIIPITEDS